MSSQPVARPPGWEGRTQEPVWRARVENRLVAPYPVRPTYREVLPVRGTQVALGIAACGLWQLLVAGQAGSLRWFVWFTLLAAGIASGVAGLLVKAGDRGVAVGLALGAALGMSIATVVVGFRWAHSGSWPLW